jgi:hypothetical protein
MALKELQVPIPEVSVEAKRELPEFVREEQRAVDRIMYPEIERPVRPTYHLIRNYTPDLAIQDTTPEMEQWASLRNLALAQTNHPRWVGSVVFGNNMHTIAWYMVSPPEVESGHYCTLRCSCNMPSFSEPDSQEYIPCEAKELVIEDRAQEYRSALQIDEGFLHFSGAVTDLLRDLVKTVRTNHLMWPPSHRSDVLLVDGLSATFGVSPKKVMDAALPLEKDKLVQIHDTDRPTLGLMAA